MAYVLCGIIAVLVITHYFERRDLYNRIMSKSLNDYRQKDTPPAAPKSAHRRVLDKWKDKGVEIK